MYVRLALDLTNRIRLLVYEKPPNNALQPTAGTAQPSGDNPDDSARRG